MTDDELRAELDKRFVDPRKEIDWRFDWVFSVALGTLMLLGGSIMVHCDPLPPDPITFTYTAQANSHSTGLAWQDAAPLIFTVPQFDTALGSLDGVDWAFGDYQQYYGGVNTMYITDFEPFIWATTEGAASPLLGLNVSSQQTNSGITGHNQQISMGGWWSENGLSASGVVVDTSQFIGTGWMTITVDLFYVAGYPQVDGPDQGSVFAAIVEAYDFGTLTVSYVDAPRVVPEPGFGYLVALVIGLVWIGLLLLTKSKLLDIIKP